MNRAQLVDDAWSLAKAGLLGYNVALDLTNYLTVETDYFPWYSAIRHLSFLRNQLLHTQNYNKFKVSIIFEMNTSFRNFHFIPHFEQKLKIIVFGEFGKVPQLLIRLKNIKIYKKILNSKLFYTIKSH